MKYPIHDTILRIVANLLTTRIFPVVFLFRKNRSKTMKSKIIIAGLLCTIIAPPALAVTKCVALSGSGTTCTSNYSQYDYHTDWAATCTTYGVSTPISGIGICSSTEAGSTAETATELDVSPTADENMHCWCKMTSPAVSRWVSGGSSGSAGGCAQVCASFCALALRDFPIFKSAMFGSLSD